MKFKRILCYILILLFCFSANAQNKAPSGIELCNEVHSFLKKNAFSPSSQSLVISGENTFPYNIIVTFTPEQNTWPENLILVFFQEDIPQNQKIILEALRKIREEKYPFTITVLFAYGEKQKLEKADMIYGSRVYLESLNTNLSYTAVIFDLESESCQISTSSNGLSSPPQLIRDAMNLYKSCGIGKDLPSFVVSQLSSYSFISSRILSSFFEYEIPAIELSLGGISDTEKETAAENIITGFVKSYSKTTEGSWEHHFLIIPIFGSWKLISENLIIRFVTPTIFAWLVFIFLLIFVNRRLKRHTWYTIGKIWWSVPLTWFLLVLCFFASGYLFRNIFTGISDPAKIYGQLIVQISSSLFITLAVYLLILNLNYGFDERAVDYLLVISCFINQSIFIMADISLCPIFIIICFLSLIALTVKNNYLHIAVFLLMLGPLVPYGHMMISSAQLSKLSKYLADNQAINIVIPLVLYPVYLVLFRIITSVRTHRKKMKYVIISTVTSFVLVTAVLSCLGALRVSGFNKKQTESPEIKLSTLGSELITLSVNDQNIFDDIIRTVDISLKEKCLLCDFTITTRNSNPVLYSDNDYVNPSANIARFRIPDNPPDEMSFKYGADKTPCRITVSAVIQGDSEGKYLFISNYKDIGDF